MSFALTLLAAAVAPQQLPAVVLVSSSPTVAPSDGVDDTAGLQVLLSSLGAGDTLIFDLPGEYELTGPPGGGPLLTISDVPDVTITAVPGVELVFTGYDRSMTGAAGRYPDGLRVRRCTNFRLEGAGPNDPLVFRMREASPTALTNEGLSFVQGELQPGYPQNNTVRLKVTDPGMFLPVTCVPDAWGAWEVQNDLPGLHAVWGGGTVQATAAPANGAQFVDITFNNTGGLPSWTSGTTVVVLLNDSNTYAVSVANCAGLVRFEHLLAQHLPGKFVQAHPNEAVHAQDVDVAPRLDFRKLSISRDGLNAGGRTLLIEDCDMLFCGDDGIVAKGSNYGFSDDSVLDLAAKSFELNSVCAAQLGSGPGSFEVGDVVVMLDGATLSSSTMETALVVGRTWTGSEWAYTYGSETAGFTGRLTGNGIAFNPHYAAQGALVRNCTVRSDRGVGITVRSVFTAVQDCAVERVSVCGLHAGGGMLCAYPWGGQGSPPHGLSITDCKFDQAGGFVDHSPITGSVEISVVQSSVPQGPTAPYWINPVYSPARDVILDVTITGNEFHNAPRAAIFAANVGGSQGIRVDGNTFVSCGGPTRPTVAEQHAVAIDTCGAGGGVGNTWINCPNQVHNPNSPSISIQ